MNHIIEYDGEYEVYNVVDVRSYEVVAVRVYEEEAVYVAEDLDAAFENAPCCGH